MNEQNQGATIKKFGDLIKSYRSQQGWSQGELGRRIGKIQRTISSYESNTIFPNSPEELKSLAAMLDITVSELIDSIEYARTGILKEQEAVLIDLNELNIEQLLKKYKFVREGEEITREEFKKMLESLEFERFKNKKNEC